MSAWIAGAIGAVSGSVLTAILLCLCRDVRPDEQKIKSERDTRTDLILLQLHKRICRLERYNCGECAELNAPSPDESFNQFKARYDDAYRRDVEANKWGRDGDRWEGLPPEVRLFAPSALPPRMWKNRFDRSARKWDEDLED